MAQIYTDNYPFALALLFLGTLFFARLPNKGAFAAREMLSLVVAVFLAHVNRLFFIVPEYLLFPSGHTTFCLGLALSLGLLRPWTLLLTLPGALCMACTLVRLHYHQVIDVIGAFPLVVIVYGAIHFWWRLPSDYLFLNRVRVST